ncbi:MAG TPA: hypothetical protein QF564_22115, partial [Pirellulaceae bacterium]|nr:hypothetical protein [Pirellulaceae bacterium]
ADVATENSLAGGATPIPSDEILGNIVATSPEFAEYHLRRSFWILRVRHLAGRRRSAAVGVGLFPLAR